MAQVINVDIIVGDDDVATTVQQLLSSYTTLRMAINAFPPLKRDDTRNTVGYDDFVYFCRAHADDPAPYIDMDQNDARALFALVQHMADMDKIKLTNHYLLRSHIYMADLVKEATPENIRTTELVEAGYGPQLDLFELWRQDLARQLAVMTSIKG